MGRETREHSLKKNFGRDSRNICEMVRALSKKFSWADRLKLRPYQAKNFV